MKKMIFLFSVIASLVGCNRPEPNYEGVLMTEYGRNGINSFKIVTGAQGMLGPGSELYQVPMWEFTSPASSMKRVFTPYSRAFQVR